MEACTVNIHRFLTSIFHCHGYTLVLFFYSTYALSITVFCKLWQCCIHVMNNSMTFVLLNEDVDNLLDSDRMHSLPCTSDYYFNT